MAHLHDHRISRRDALAALGAIAVTARAGIGHAQEVDKPKIAIQLYTMRNPAKEDLAGTLKKVREMGWEYVQWSGMPDLSADQIRAALDTAGLKAIAAHCGVEPFETDFDAQVAFWKTVGVTAVGPGGMMGDCKETITDWIRGAKRLDAVGEKLQSVGMYLTYHNHAGELEKYEGDPRCKLDILAAETNPKNLIFELDLAWLAVGNADPSEFLRKYKGRCTQVHAKDAAFEEGKRNDGTRKFKFTPLGQGDLNWDEIFAAGKEAGVKWWIYEQDSGEGSPFDYAQASYEFLSKRIPNA